MQKTRTISIIAPAEGPSRESIETNKQNNDNIAK